jgi:thiol-disulfide isomerase/thioredoxin
VLFALLACVHPAPVAASSPPAPASKVEVVDEARVASVLHSAPGVPLVASVWASWCTPCISELPLFEHFAATHPEVRVLLVNADLPETRPDAVRLAPPTPTVWYLDTMDPGGLLARVWPEWDGAIPATVVLGPDGSLRASYKGTTTLDALEAATATSVSTAEPRW